MPGTFTPILICALIGLFCEVYFFAVLGLGAFLRVYIWPGLLLTIFWLWCLFTRRYQPWHRIVWRAAQAWNGFWAFVFIGEIVSVFLIFPLAYLFGALIPVAWLEDAHFNPFLAGFVHVMTWACVSDVVSSLPPRPNHTLQRTEAGGGASSDLRA